MRLPRVDPLCSLKVARASKISGRKFSAVARRKPTGLTSAEMAALRCNAAARSGFLLAALHSVAERVTPRKARAPAPHGPRVLAKQRVPIWRCWEKSARLPRPGKNHNTESCDLFHPRGSPRWLGIGNEAADRGGGGVRCGLRADGDKR